MLTIRVLLETNEDIHYMNVNQVDGYGNVYTRGYDY